MNPLTTKPQNLYVPGAMIEPGIKDSADAKLEYGDLNIHTKEIGDILVKRADIHSALIIHKDLIYPGNVSFWNASKWVPLKFRVMTTQSTANHMTTFRGSRIRVYLAPADFNFNWRSAKLHGEVVVPHRDGKYYINRHPAGVYARQYRDMMAAAEELCNDQ